MASNASNTRRSAETTSGWSMKMSASKTHISSPAAAPDASNRARSSALRGA
jgi:hypothetical protein